MPAGLRRLHRGRMPLPHDADMMWDELIFDDGLKRDLFHPILFQDVRIGLTL
jgi:hypothetical protein